MTCFKKRDSENATIFCACRHIRPKYATFVLRYPRVPTQADKIGVVLGRLYRTGFNRALHLVKIVLLHLGIQRIQ